jgi:hypothetical protein
MVMMVKPLASAFATSTDTEQNAVEYVEHFVQVLREKIVALGEESEDEVDPFTILAHNPQVAVQLQTMLRRQMPL